MLTRSCIGTMLKAKNPDKEEKRKLKGFLSSVCRPEKRKASVEK